MINKKYRVATRIYFGK